MSTGKNTQRYVDQTASCDPDKRLKLIQIPDPVCITKRKGRGRVEGFLEQGRTVDFLGWLRGAGRAVALECKETSNEKRWQLDARMKDHQLSRLLEATKDGAIACVYVRKLSHPSRDFLIPVTNDSGLPFTGASVRWENLERWKIPPRNIWMDALIHRGVVVWEDYTVYGWRAVLSQAHTDTTRSTP